MNEIETAVFDSGARQTYTVDEVAELLGINRGTAYEAVRTGEIPAVRIGRRWLVPKHQLRALLGEPDLAHDAEGAPKEVSPEGRPRIH